MNRDIAWTAPLTVAEADLLARATREAVNVLSNTVCNEVRLENTPANLALAYAVVNRDNEPDDRVRPAFDGGRIALNAEEVLQYFAARVNALATPRTEAATPEYLVQTVEHQVRAALSKVNPSATDDQQSWASLPGAIGEADIRWVEARLQEKHAPAWRVFAHRNDQKNWSFLFSRA